MAIQNSAAHLAGTLGYTEQAMREIILHAADYYRPFHLVVTKPNGKVKERHIDNPHKKLPLKALQTAINKKLLVPAADTLPKNLIGSMPKRKPIEHIQPHIGQPTVVCMDLANCFPTITHKQIVRVWRDLFGFNDELAVLLADATTFQGYLPQGPPTSPLLCNFALRGMATEIAAYGTKNDLNYTQFVDDVCISGNDVAARNAINHVYKVASAHGQTIKTSKTEVQDSSERQLSGNLVLNKGARVQRKYIDELVHAIKAAAATGEVSTGQKASLLGKIQNVKTYSQKQGARIEQIYNDAMREVSFYEGSFPKKGVVMNCPHFAKRRAGKCPSLLAG